MKKMWQDSQIRFDTSLSDMQVQHGEFIIDKLDMIEDMKGNVGDQGRLIISNLRIMWHSLTLPRINLSMVHFKLGIVYMRRIYNPIKNGDNFIVQYVLCPLVGIGYNTVINMTAKNLNMLQGNFAQALHILTVYKNYRYEFIFNNLNTKSTRHYTSVIGVYRAFISTKLYREIKLRGGFVQNKRLNILPLENINSTTPGVWNLSAEQGNVGTFIITNIRITWFADVNCQFNVSLPYLAITDVHIKTSKFGPTLVIMCAESKGGYVLGFRIDPVKKLHILHKEISTLKASYTKTPIYGVEYVFECQGVSELELREKEIREVNDVDEEISNVFGLYFNETSSPQRKPYVCLHLGLAGEAPREGSSLQSLWELYPSA